MIQPKRSSGAQISALVLSLVVTMTAIGLTTAGENKATRHVIPTDANAQRSTAAATGGGTPSLPPGAPNDDPELMRIDRANTHHG